MTQNCENNVRNEFYVPELVTLVVLHVHILQKTKKLNFQHGRRRPYWILPFVAIFWRGSISISFNNTMYNVCAKFHACITKCTIIIGLLCRCTSRRTKTRMCLFARPPSSDSDFRPNSTNYFTV